MSKEYSVKMNKSGWQKLAKENDVVFKSKDTVAELVSAIAKKLKVKTTKKQSVEDIKENIINSLIPSEDTNDGELERLRKDCEDLGMAWSEVHTVADLKQLIEALKGSNFTKPVEVNVENIESTTPSAPPSPPEPFNPINTEPNPNIAMASNVSIQEPTEVDLKNLEIYRDSFTGTIRGHFRLMTMNEVVALFNQSNYPFTYTIERNPKNPNLISFTFVSGTSTVRVPSENKNEWIAING